MYISTATIETLKLFKNANLIEFELIYKRLDKKTIPIVETLNL